MTKKYKKKRKKYISKNMKILAGVGIAAVIIMVISVYSMLGKYNGLGIQKPIGENPYSIENFSEINGEVFYEDDMYKGETVIDVSTYQRNVDFEKVKADGVSGVMIRLGYRGTEKGELCLDDRFRENIDKAVKADIKTGVYFFSQAVSTEEAIEEARFVIRNIRGKGVELPVAFDMEPVAGADRIKGLTKREKTEIADAFCQVIKRNGYEPVVYGNPTWLNNHIDMEYLTDYGVWLAHYTYFTDFNSRYCMWQYTDSGQVNGIEGNVDLNIYLTEREK